MTRDESTEPAGMLHDGSPDPVFAFFADPTARAIVRALDDGTEDAAGRPTGMRSVPEKQILSLEHGRTWLQRGRELGLLERHSPGPTLHTRLRTHHAILVLNAAAKTAVGEAFLNTFGMRATVPVISRLLRNGAQTQTALDLEKFFPKSTVTTAIKALQEVGVVDESDALLRIVPAEIEILRRIHTTVLLIDEARLSERVHRRQAMVHSLYNPVPDARAPTTPDVEPDAPFVDIVPAEWASQLDARLRRLETGRS